METIASKRNDLHRISLAPLVRDHPIWNGQQNLVVDVPVELQISRTISRDDTDEAGVKAIIAAQMDRQERLSKADDVILNDKDLDHLLSEVDKLHETYLQMSTSKA